jgi:hypothetical protein
MTPQVDFASQEYFRNPAAGIEKLRAGTALIELLLQCRSSVLGRKRACRGHPAKSALGGKADLPDL